MFSYRPTRIARFLFFNQSKFNETIEFKSSIRSGKNKTNLKDKYKTPIDWLDNDVLIFFKVFYI